MDPGRTVTLERAAIPASKRIFLEPGKQEALLAAVVKSPADPALASILRYVIARDRNPDYVHECFQSIWKAISQRIDYGSAEARLESLYFAGLVQWVKKCQDGGLFQLSARSDLQFVNGTVAGDDLFDPSIVRRVEDSYMQLGFMNGLEGRKLWRQTVDRFGETPALCVYGFLMFSTMAYGTTVGGRPGEKPHREPSLDYNEDKPLCRRLAYRAWKEAPDQVGVMARVAQCLVWLKDQRAPEAVRQYLALGDDPDRLEWTQKRYPGVFGGGSKP